MIKIKPSRRGLLHRKMGVPTGTKIPVAALRKEAKSGDEATRREAQFALNARKFKRK